MLEMFDNISSFYVQLIQDTFFNSFVFDAPHIIISWISSGRSSNLRNWFNISIKTPSTRSEFTTSLGMDYSHHVTNFEVHFATWQQVVTA